MKSASKIFKLTRNCVYDRIHFSLSSESVNSFNSHQHLFDTAAKSINTDSNFLVLATLVLFQFRPKCTHFNLFTVMLISRKLHGNMCSTLAKWKKCIRFH